LKSEKLYSARDTKPKEKEVNTKTNNENRKPWRIFVDVRADSSVLMDRLREKKEEVIKT
jgi:hypothetical protein